MNVRRHSKEIMYVQNTVSKYKCKSTRNAKILSIEMQRQKKFTDFINRNAKAKEIQRFH